MILLLLLLLLFMTGELLALFIIKSPMPNIQILTDSNSISPYFIQYLETSSLSETIRNYNHQLTFT